jgi:hypothetical protein
VHAFRRYRSGKRPNIARAVDTWRSAPPSTFSSTVARPTSPKLWYTVPNFERTAPSVCLPTTIPSTSTLPEVSVTRPLTARSNVDFPAPEEPRITQNWPRGTSSVTPRSATVPSG